MFKLSFSHSDSSYICFLFCVRSQHRQCIAFAISLFVCSFFLLYFFLIHFNKFIQKIQDKNNGNSIKIEFDLKIDWWMWILKTEHRLAVSSKKIKKNIEKKIRKKKNLCCAIGKQFCSVFVLFLQTFFFPVQIDLTKKRRQSIELSTYLNTCIILIYIYNEGTQIEKIEKQKTKTHQSVSSKPSIIVRIRWFYWWNVKNCVFLCATISELYIFLTINDKNNNNNDCNKKKRVTIFENICANDKNQNQNQKN